MLIMPRKSIKKILAGYSIAGLLTATVFTAGCSDRPNISEKQAGQKTYQEEEVIVVDEADKATQSENKEIKIRGKSG